MTPRSREPKGGKLLATQQSGSAGKKAPLTLDEFEEFFRLPPERADSQRNWSAYPPGFQNATPHEELPPQHGRHSE